MINTLHQTQQKIKNLKDQINDILHLTSLNNQSIICLASSKNPQNINRQQNQSQQSYQGSINQSLQNHILQKHSILQYKINNFPDLLQKRTQNHLNYLIVRQIQGEQQTVRRQRLNEYEDKIYDQRRLISDKEAFLQNLYRPKKQRPQTMSSQQFQQLRAKQRLEQEKFKLYSLGEEINKLTIFHEKLSQIKINQNKRTPNESRTETVSLSTEQLKNKDLQKTKAHSLETVNLSVFNNFSQKPQTIVQEAELNTTLNQNSQKKIDVLHNLTLKNNPMQHIEGEKNVSMSQKVFQQQKSRANFTIQLNKFMKNCEKKMSKQDMRQKLQRIKHLILRIEQKKEDNNIKRKQLIEMEKQSFHMSAHLQIVKENYMRKLQTVNFRKRNQKVKQNQ